MGKVISVIFLTSSECNLICSYCYVRASRQNVRKFNKENLEVAIRNCSMGFDSIEFCWHGGEPLLMGIDFYKEAVRVQKAITSECKAVFYNNLQSNGLSLNDEWLNFIEENNFHLGLSLDAPSEVNKLQRKFDYEKLLPIFEKIQKRNMPLGLLSVITKHNVSKADEIFNFFKSLGVNSFGVLALKDVSLSGRPLMPSNEELYGFYIRLFDLWAFTQNSFSCIEPLDTMLRSLLGQNPRGCSFSSSCLKRMITIDQEGNVVPCGSLVSEEFILGNITKAPLIASLMSQKAKRLRFQRKAYMLKKCSNCEYVSMCRGGCRADAFWFSGRYDGDYPFCEARKKTFSYIQSRLKEILPR